ncbi:MAG: hypothetical protein ACUZ9M_09915 [Candidatus Scalindua sp.]
MTVMTQSAFVQGSKDMVLSFDPDVIELGVFNLFGVYQQTVAERLPACTYSGR